MWTKYQAEQFIKEIEPLLNQNGYKPEIVGSVKVDGYSNNDLDILLIPMNDNFNFEPIFEHFNGDFFESAYGEVYQFYVTNFDELKIVEFWFDN